MKVKSKIKSLILLFVAFVLSAVFGVFSLNLGVKNVSGASTPADFDISGMSLRYTESGAEKAVRFHVTMTEETYNATIAKGAESGVLIIPKSLLQGNLTLSTELAVNCMFDTETWGENEEGLYEARAVLTDIPEKNYGTKLAVVAYYTLNGVTTYSEKYDNGSLAAVAVMEKEAYPDKEGVDQLVDEYATFDVKVTVGETTYTLPIVYGNEVPFAEALGLTNTAGTVEWGNRQVTGNVNLKASTSAVTLAETYELDLDINNDGTLNASNNLAFDLSALNVDSLTFGSDYTLTKIKVGDTEITTGLEGVTASGSTLYVPASVLGYVYGNQAVTFTFSYGGLSIDVQANALLISKKISNKTELDAMNTIMAKYLDAEANTYGGYFVLDANVTYADSALWAAGTKNVAPWVPAFTGLETNGFVGTFDGQGNAIEGLLGYNKAVENGFITEIGVGGTLKNVAFTNAIASRNASVVAAENNGLIENVYVHFYVLGAWIGDAGYFTEYNSGWAGNSMAVFNGGSWNATGEVKNVFVDFTDSAKLNYSDASTNANYGLSWHENASGTILLGKTANASAYQHGVYAVGIPEACANPVRNQAASDLFNWYVNEDAFDAAYGAENSAIKAEIDTWPVWLRERIPVDVPVQTLTETQKVDLDIQVNDKVVSLNEKATASLDLSGAGEINSIEKITMDGKAIEGTLDGSTVVLPVAQFGYAYGETTITVTTDLKKIVVPVLLVSKTIKTAEDIDEFGYIAQAIGNTENNRSDGMISDGYFELGQDIAYNGTYVAWQARGPFAPLWWAYVGQTGGFAGTFDGCGYTIDGMTAGTGYNPDGVVKGNAAFIPVLNKDGIIRNVAFTNAGINNSNTASGFLIAVGQGVIENVYVQMTAAAGFSLGGVIFGTDNVRGVSGPTLRNVFVDTTAITTHYAGATFYAVGGNNNDKYNAAGEEVADGVADPFGIYDSVYAVVAINEDRNYVGTAFGAGGAYEGSQNYAAYAGTAAFVEAYETNNNLKATFDSLNEMFGIELFNVIPVEATSETKKINLNVSLVDGVATTAATASVDLSEVVENLATVTSLTYGETAMDGATVSGATLTLPLTVIAATTYGESENLVLVANDTEGKQYTITIPTFFVTKVITTKAELDGFSAIAAAVATAENTWDGYFELGNSIVYNDNLAERAGNGTDLSVIPSKWNSTWAGTSTNGFVGVFDGQGYAIDGLLTYDGGFIPTLGATGVMKNIAFTNMLIGSKGGVVGYNLGAVENVYTHVYAFGVFWGYGTTWCSFAHYNPGATGSNTAIINGSGWDATGSIRNMVVDMTDSAKKMYLESNKDWYEKSWLDHTGTRIRIFGLAASNAAHEGVYVIGVPMVDTDYIKFVHLVPETDNFARFADYDSYVEACGENETMKTWAKNLDTSFWKIENGAPAYKYADVETIYELNADLSLNAEKTAVSTAARGAVALSEIDTDFGELEYVKYNGVDLGGEYAEGEVTFDMSGFGVNFGEQTIEIKFVDGVPFTAKVFVVSKVLYNANHIDDFGYIAQVIGNTKNSLTDGKISDGYFTLGQNIAYNGTYVAWQSRGVTPLWWDTGVAQGFAGTFDGCGYSIDGMTAGTGYRPDTGAVRGYAAFIPILHTDGIIRNVAFTNAGINNSNTASGFLIAAGQGVVENVYVQLTSAASFNVGAAIFGTDNVRGVSGPTLRNVFVDTTALTTGHSQFFAVGGNSGDNYNSAGESGADGVADPFGIYDGVYAMVNNATQQGIAFGKGGAYAGSQNYAAYTGIEAFGEAYWTDETMKATIDKLDALFGLGLNFDAYKATEIALTETQNFDLDVTPSLTMAENVSVDLSEVGNDLGFLESATLTNGGSAYALRSASKELTDATLTDGVLTVPTSGNFTAADYGDYTLTVETSNKYIITLPVALATGVIETKEDLDSFGEIALAMGGGNGVYDGYFKLGADIEYNETVKVKTEGNVWNPWFGIGAAADNLSFTTYDSLNKVTGFQGVFDGGGYSIHGWRCHYKSGWYVNGFITKVAEGGVIRNVAFTDVVNGGMSSVITAQNDGLIENVYVHYYTNGAWVGSAGSFVEFNEGWTSEATATFNGANENATGTIRNVVVDMSESAKLNTENDPAKNGLCWLDDLDEVYPLGRAVNATYEGVYAIGIPDSHAYVMGRALSNEILGWYKDAASASEKYYKNGDLQSIINGLDTSFWKVIDGVASYKYADSKVATELDLDLVLSADKASAAPANETLNLAIGKDLGTLTSATFNEVDLGGKYNAATGMLTVNAAAFGYAYGNQTITVSFQDGLGKAHTFDVSVLLVTKTLKTKDDVTNFGYISKLCESDTKTWGGYFKLGNDIDYGGAGYVGFINPSANTANTITGDPLGWGWTLGNGFIGTFDGCGHTIDKLWLNSENYCRSFISVVGNGGVIRNVAFTNARKGGSGGFVSSGGTGLIENVYVKMDIFGTNSAGGNDGWVSGDGIGVFFATPNGDAALSLKNCFVDASSAQVGATNTLYDRVGAIASLGNASNTTKKYTGTMSGVYLISDTAGNIKALRDMNTTEGTLANTTGVTTHNGKDAFLAAYNGATQTREDIRNLPEWMKALIFGGEATEPAALTNFIENGFTDYAVVIGEKDALGKAYSVQAGEPIGKAYNFLVSQVEKATGVKLEKSEAGDNAKHRIVIGDWTLFEGAGLSLNEGEYGVFVEGGTAYIMAYNAEDYHPAILKFLEIALGYRAYAMSGVGSSKADLTDGTTMQDTTFDGFIEYLSVNNGVVAALADSSYNNVTVFEYRSNGAWNLANADGLYAMGNKVFKENSGAWHNTFAFVDPAVAHTVNGNTYAAYTDSISTLNAYSKKNEYSYSNVDYKLTSHPWFASSYSTYYVKDGGIFYTSAQAEMVQTGATSSPYQLCYTAHGNATAYTDLVAYIGGQLIALANEHPEYEIFNFTQQDNGWACACESCTANGMMPSDTFLAFLDDLLAYVNNAENGLTRSPIKIAYFAYNAYLPAPTAYDYDEDVDGQQLNPNTYLVLAPIGAYYDEAMNEGTNATTDAWVSSSGNSAWYSDWYDVEAWLTMTGGSGVKVYLWTYEINQYTWFAARDSFDAQLENYKLFAEYSNIEVITTEHLWHNANVSAFGQLKAYLNSKAMMDPDADDVTYDGLVNEFFGRNSDGTFTGKGYYGPAGKDMYDMYTTMRGYLADFDGDMEKGKGKPYNATKLSWTKTQISKLLGYISNANTAIDNSGVSEELKAIYKEHILIESLMPRFLDAYKELGAGYSNIDEYRTEFLQDAKAFGYVRFASGATETSMYWLENKWFGSNTVYTVAPETYY